MVKRGKMVLLFAGSAGLLLAALGASGLIDKSLAAGSGGCADLTFGTSQYSGSTGASGTSFFTAHNLAVSSTEVTNSYSSGSDAVRIGSGSNPGSIVFTFSSGYVISKVKVLAYKYSDGSANVSVATSAHSTAQSLAVSLSAAPNITDASTEAGLVFSGLDNGEGTSSTTFTISSSKRFNLCKIVFTLGAAVASSSSSEESSSSSSSSESSSSGSSSSSSSSSSVSTGAGTYYSSIDWTATGAALKTSLFNLINDHTDKGYAYAWTAYKAIDVDANGKIIDMYSSYHFTPGTDQAGTYSKEGDVYNREHTIPQSVFSEASPMKADLHHLYPTDGYVNNRRSNYPHGAVSGTATYTSSNGCKLGTASSSLDYGYTGTVFEVPDVYKGDFARTYFYMVTCYQDKLSGWGDFAAFNKTAYPSLANWARQLYLAWSDLDPVSDKEIKRNNGVYGIQNNRNPFIDHPEAAHAIWDSATY